VRGKVEKCCWHDQEELSSSTMRGLSGSGLFVVIFVAAIMLYNTCTLC
jgi:hypothetical protein